jgi:phospholipid/cholesterol/gamma-HCH transport system permease protein
MGADALPPIAGLAFMNGMALAYQGTVQLQRFGAGPYIADIVGLAMVRSIAPLITAVIVTGRTGAAIAAQLGTMRVRSEIDALAAMGVDPVRYLVVPRVAALLFVMPILTLATMFIGMIGGMAVAANVSHVTPLAFWTHVLERLEFADFARSLLKSIGFASIIGITGAHCGMRAAGGAAGVGSVTTRAVVASISGIIVFDSLFETVATLLRGAP